MLSTTDSNPGMMTTYKRFMMTTYKRFKSTNLKSSSKSLTQFQTLLVQSYSLPNSIILCQHVATTPSCPPWPTEACHPLGCSLLPHLPLHPTRHLPPLSCLPRLRRDHPHPRDQTLGLCSHNTTAQKSAILTSDSAQLPLQLWTACRSAEMCHLALSASNNQLVQVC